MGKPRKHFKPHEHVYGVCHSDHKRATKYENYSINYFSIFHDNIPFDEIDWGDEEEEKSFFVCDTFYSLGLPLPAPHEIHYGTDGSLLFLNSHGIVIRIHDNCDGDPRLFLHPHILQPVGWVTSKELNVTIALYPAADIISSPSSQQKAASTARKSLKKSNFKTDDLGTHNNTGCLQLKRARYPLAIDVSFRIGERPNEQGRKTTRDAFNKRRKKKPAFEALKVLFKHHASSEFSQSECAEIFNFHQPLRHAFFMAWKEADKDKGDPNPVRMQRFWQMAFNYTQNGYKIYGKLGTNPNKVLLSTRRMNISWNKVSKKSYKYA